MRVGEDGEAVGDAGRVPEDAGRAGGVRESVLEDVGDWGRD